MIRLLRWMLAAYRLRRECRRAGLPRGLAGRIRQAERVAINRALLIDPTDPGGGGAGRGHCQRQVFR